MEINYTNYSEETIIDRKIDKRDIEGALRNPDEIVEGKTGRKIAHKIIGDKLLRVVFEKDVNTYIVITAYYTQARRYMNHEN
jgi:transcriptional regulator NrdR family protein